MAGDGPSWKRADSLFAAAVGFTQGFREGEKG